MRGLDKGIEGLKVTSGPVILYWNSLKQQKLLCLLKLLTTEKAGAPPPTLWI